MCPCPNIILPMCHKNLSKYVGKVINITRSNTFLAQNTQLHNTHSAHLIIPFFLTAGSINTGFCFHDSHFFTKSGPYVTLHGVISTVPNALSKETN